jgi:hypothetical protein
MSTQHTPGPWTAVKLQDRETFNIFADGFVSATCQVSRMENSTRSTSGSETTANARLIAAAPDLLEALRVCASQSIGADWTPEQALAFIKQHARAVIAKVTGEQP